MSQATADWFDAAACKGRDGSIFFPPTVTEKKEDRLLREAAAKAICQACPVKDRCLTDAMTKRDFNGIWGGLTEDERRALSRLT
jgi:WhiB family transcriptional regulator, redox-sensing transcriptional regulator